MSKRKFLSLVLLVSLACAAHSFDTGTPAGFYENARYSPLLELISTAKQSIDLEVYEMDDPKVLDALYEALDRGVHLQIVQEPTPMGGRCHVFKAIRDRDDDSCRARKSFVHQVRARGGRYVEFNKALCGVDGKSCFQHGKMAIFDKKTALISSGNFNSTSLCNLDTSIEVCNRDYSYITSDAYVLTNLNAVFAHDLNAEVYDLSLVLSHDSASKITVGPIGLSPIIAFIQSAKHSIQVQNQYLHEPILNEALIAAAHKGVKVQVTVASVCNFERPKASVKERATRIYSAFEEAGIQSRFFTRQILINGKAGYLHTKAIIVDGTRAWVGSMNGSTEAATMNREFGLFFDNVDDVRVLAATMNSDHFNKGTESWRESIACLKDGR